MTSEKALPLIANDLPKKIFLKKKGGSIPRVVQQELGIGWSICRISHRHRFKEQTFVILHCVVHSKRVDSKMEKIDRVADRFRFESGLIPSRTLKLITLTSVMGSAPIHLPILVAKYQEQNEGHTSSLVVHIIENILPTAA